MDILPSGESDPEIFLLVRGDAELEHEEEGQHSGRSGVIRLVSVGCLLGVDRAENLVDRLQQLCWRFLVEGHLVRFRFTTTRTKQRRSKA